MEIITKIPQIDKTTAFPPTVWYGCYDGGWQNLIQPEAYAHPAKFSRSLISRIYSYALERGWLKPGDTVLDCFGGVGLGALDAQANGLNYIGVELEARFCDLGQGCECTGISKADWIRYHGRWDKMAHKDGRHWCPQCLAEAKQVTDSQQLSLFEPAPSAAYVRNSGIIPSTQPHYYRGNLDLFRKYAKPGTWAVLLNGDSRNLRAVIGQAQVDGLLSSPPYSSYTVSKNGIDASKFDRKEGPNSQAHTMANYGQTTGQLGAMKPGSLADSLLSSPPYINSVNQSAQANDTEARIERMRQAGIDVTNRANVGGGNGVARQPQNYGSTDGQLGAMKEGSLGGLVSSPPFAEAQTGGTDIYNKLEVTHKRKFTERSRANGYRADLQGNSEGQLSALPAGSLADSLVASPPFAGNTGGRGEASRNGIDAALFDRHSGGMKKGTGDDPGNLDHLPMRGLQDALVSSPPFEEQRQYTEDRRSSKFKADVTFKAGQSTFTDYGQTTGQLGIEQGQTFWAAAREIVTESYLALKPGAYTFWVVKNFVRDGAIVDFRRQWKQLCEACGFEFVEHIQAMLIQSESEQGNLNGDVIKTKKKKSSFFRRLHEKKFPHLAIDNEDVIVMRKPEAVR